MPHNTVTVVDLYAPFTLFAVSNCIRTRMSELDEARIKGRG